MITIPEILKKVKGRKIIGIVTDYDVPDHQNKSNSLEIDAGEIYIILDNGDAIKCWNSEWGGIDIGKIKAQDEQHIFVDGEIVFKKANIFFEEGETT